MLWKERDGCYRLVMLREVEKAAIARHTKERGDCYRLVMLRENAKIITVHAIS